MNLKVIEDLGCSSLQNKDGKDWGMLIMASKTEQVKILSYILTVNLLESGCCVTGLMIFTMAPAEGNWNSYLQMQHSRLLPLLHNSLQVHIFQTIITSTYISDTDLSSLKVSDWIVFCSEILSRSDDTIVFLLSNFFSFTSSLVFSIAFYKWNMPVTRVL